MLEVGLPAHGDSVVPGLLLHMLQPLLVGEELVPVEGSGAGPRVAQNFPKLKHPRPHESHICYYATYEDSKNTNNRSVAYA